MSSNLKFTGERLVPTELHEIAVEHLARYAFCIPLIKNKNVLDLACGEGYGTSLLSKSAATVIGVDLDKNTVAHAAKRYTTKSVQFIESAAEKLPFKEKQFDVVVSFETIEHLSEQDLMIAEIKRVLKADGILIISTPNKIEHEKKGKKNNPFHVKELAKDEFKSLLDKYFSEVSFYYQQNVYGSFLYPEDQRFQYINEVTGSFKNLVNTNKLECADYFLAVASNIPSKSNALFFHASNIYEKRFESLKKTITYRVGHALLAPLKWLSRRK